MTELYLGMLVVGALVLLLRLEFLMSFTWR